MNNLATIGSNSPPGPVQSAKDALGELRNYLQDNPVIQSPEDAKAANGWRERTMVALKEMEEERTQKVGPLNAQVKKINDLYRGVRDPLEKVLTELKRRLTAYATAVEAERIAAANKARAEAEEKERLARAAEAAEQETIANAAQGECTDVAGAIEGADRAFADYQKANRAAAVAERDVPVRLGSVMGGRSISMKTTEVLTVTDAVAALKCLGLTPKITEAILSSAREYRKAHGELPAGVTATFERSM